MSSRLTVTYEISPGASDAAAVAEDICLEQTVEVAPQLAAEPFFGRNVVGRIQELTPLNDGLYGLKIGFPSEVFATGISQLISVIYGNISLKPGIRVKASISPEDVLLGIEHGHKNLRRFVAETN